MSKFRLALSLFLLFVTVQTAVAVSVPELDSLDRYIGLKKMFEGRKYARIDKEKRAVASRPSFSSYMKLGKEYTLFKADSAIFYYDKAAELASSPTDSLLVRMKKCARRLSRAIMRRPTVTSRRFRTWRFPTRCCRSSTKVAIASTLSLSMALRRAGFSTTAITPILWRLEKMD